MTEHNDEPDSDDSSTEPFIRKSLEPDEAEIRLARRKPGPMSGYKGRRSTYEDANIHEGDQSEYFDLRLTVEQAADLYQSLGSYLEQYQEQLEDAYSDAPHVHLVYAYPSHLYDPEDPRGSPFEPKLIEACLTKRQAYEVEHEVMMGERASPFDTDVLSLDTLTETVPLNPRKSKQKSLSDSMFESPGAPIVSRPKSGEQEGSGE